jgi:peptidyl-prolyl isomerase G (cyclophilin G)
MPVSSNRAENDDEGKKLTSLVLPTHCYLSVSIAGDVQREPIVIELLTDACPITCRNFVCLCSSTETTQARKPCPSYRGCDFHRIVDQFMVQAGDFERFDGTGGYSPLHVNAGGTFPDENLKGKHDQAGTVSMANKGKNTNGSQFFITLKATPHLDGKHVVFGRVVQGLNVVENMVHVERDGDRPVPMQRVVIADCGVGFPDKVLDGTAGEKGKKSHKKKKKKRSRASKKKRRHSDSYSSDSSDSDDSSSLASTRSSRSDPEAKRNKKKRKRRSRDVSSNDDDDDSSHDKHRSKKRKKHKKERSTKYKRR